MHKKKNAIHHFRTCKIGAFVMVLALLLAGWSSPALAEDGDLPQVYVGGQSIGIFLHDQGVTVVGFAPVYAEDGRESNPAAEAGLQTGDCILEINGETVTGQQQMTEIIGRWTAGDPPLKLRYSRNGDKEIAWVTPAHCSRSQCWRIGLYVRDDTAGIGTLTFYEPSSGVYGALGHQVSNAGAEDGGDALGAIGRAPISGIRIGKAGSPGEKMGVFIAEPTGDVQENTVYGLFGILYQKPQPLYRTQTLPLAQVDEVKTGPAELLTVIDGEKIQSFQVNIAKINANYKSSGKGMVIEITDRELIRKTGGIIQGMSGSPIVQNGKLAGAVSHVFVNDPLHGYACFAQWMWEKAEPLEAGAA
ncbi:MAG: SpoIVB peptidase [Firmicutes bacterium]|nr:SpoIVB peptidase [Bacillota bacterium]